MKNKSSIRIQKNKLYIIINNMWMSATKPYYIMYVDYISKVCIHYLLWNNNFRVDEYIISIQFLNYLISFSSNQKICFWTLWSKYMWYDVNWHYILIVIILFGINMNNFIKKTYIMINFRYQILIFRKYSLTCSKGVQNASDYLEMIPKSLGHHSI